MKQDILAEIIANKRQEVEERKASISKEELIKEFITEDNKTEIMSFFTRLGIYPKIKNGYYYPSSNQATTIKDALTKEVLRKNIVVKNNTIVEIVYEKNGWGKLKSTEE